VPVDGDTYDVPQIIAVASARRKEKGQPEPKFGHEKKFGTKEQWVEYSAVTHVAKGKEIPPFLLLHVAAHADTTQQAKTLGDALTAAGISAKLFGASDTDHVKLDANLGPASDPAPKELFAFMDAALKR
jgi:hypothetical protein